MGAGQKPCATAHIPVPTLCVGDGTFKGLPFRLIRLPSSLCRSCTGVVRTQILGLAREWKGKCDIYDRAITKRGRQVLEATTSRPLYSQQQNRVDTTSNPLECASTHVLLYRWGQLYPVAGRKYKTILIYQSKKSLPLLIYAHTIMGRGLKKNKCCRGLCKHFRRRWLAKDPGTQPLASRCTNIRQRREGNLACCAARWHAP